MAACAAVVIGCGGGGGGGSKRSGTTGTNLASGGMTVNLDATGYGRVEVSYLTGEIRAPGDTYLEITRQAIQNGDGRQNYQRDSISPLRLRLTGFQNLTAAISVPFGANVGEFNSQLLTQLVFDPNRALIETSTGTFTETPLPTASNAPNLPANLTLPANLEARIRAFPGRTSLVQLRVSTGSFYADPAYATPTYPSGYVFDRAQFANLNNSDTGTDPSGLNTLASRLSDFVRFDLSGFDDPADLPNIQTGFGEGEVSPNGAGYVYFSGDNVALSEAAPGGVFQELEPETERIMLGRWQTKKGDFPATYSLTDPNSNDPDGIATRLVALYGTFRDYTEVLSGGGTFEVVLLPNSGEQYDATRRGDVVGIYRQNGQIKHLFYGGANLAQGKISLLPIYYLGVSPTYGETGGDPTFGKYPAASTLPADAEGDVGTLSDYTDRSGGSTTSANAASIRKMKFTLTQNLVIPNSSGGLDTIVPSGTSGTVTVFRN